MDLKSIAAWALTALAVIFSVLSAIVTVLDKSRARKGGRRVPEATLFTLASLGGAAVMLIVMLLIRHKTKHLKFMLGLPLIILYQALIVYLIVV